MIETKTDRAAVEAQITVAQYTCQRCGYQWLPKIVEPKTCPECKTPNWRAPRQTCKRCGHRWMLRSWLDRSDRCPKCHRSDWDSEVQNHKLDARYPIPEMRTNQEAVA